MVEVLALAQKLSGIGFGTMLAVILIGSYYRKWVWGRELDELRAGYEKQLGEVKDARNKWESIAIRAAGLAENVVAIVKPRDAS
jgi:hypothetical protein